MRYSDYANKLLTLADGFDDYEEERTATNQFRRRWAKDGRLLCAICDLGDAAQIEVAHRRALEEHGHTEEDNLLPLCRSTADDGKAKDGQHLLSQLLNRYEGRDASIQAAVDEQRVWLGCHDLLDNGVIPKSGFARNARTEALKTPLKELEGEFGIRGKRGRIEKHLEELRVSRIPEVQRVLRDAEDKAESLAKICGLISLLRRCADRDVNRALGLCRAIETEFRSTSVNGVPLSRFHYEYALAHQVGTKQELLMLTRTHLTESCKVAPVGSSSWGMSQLELVHAEILVGTATEVVRRTDEWISRQDEGLAAVQSDSKPKPPNKARWRMNYLMHRAKLHAKAAFCGHGRSERLKDALREAWAFRDGLTIMAGWTRFQGVHLVTLEGLLLHLQGYHDQALRCLARGLRPMTRGRGKRPEGLRDIAYCMAACHTALGSTVKAEQARKYGDGLFDQRSGVVLPVV